MCIRDRATAPLSVDSTGSSADGPKAQLVQIKQIATANAAPRLFDFRRVRTATLYDCIRVTPKPGLGVSQGVVDFRCWDTGRLLDGMAGNAKAKASTDEVFVHAQ